METYCPVCSAHNGHAPDCDFVRYETQGRRVRGRSSCGGLTLLAIVLAALVACCGFSKDLVLGQLAPDRGLTETEKSAIERLTSGRWEGTYDCGSGRHGLRLSLTRAATKQRDLIGVIDFFKSGRATGTPTGSYRLKGGIIAGRLDLRPDSWIKQAQNYRRADLLASLPDGDAMEAILDRGSRICRAFTLTRKA